MTNSDITLCGGYNCPIRSDCQRYLSGLKSGGIGYWTVALYKDGKCPVFKKEKKLKGNNMKAISIKQPWASLIVSGLKDIENRTWKTNFRGRVLIHEGKTVSKNGWREMNQKQIDVAANSKMMGAKFNELPFGAIIGSVEIVDCVQNHPSLWAEKGVWNWVLKDTILFDKPIEGVKGKLGFWNFKI